jgi:hypothetical protein
LLSRAIDDSEVVTGEEFGLAGLSAVQHFRRHKVLKVSVIRQDSDRGLSSFEFRTPFFKATDDSEQFLIVDLVITLNGRVFLRKEGDRAQDTFFVILGEYSSGYKVGSVGFQDSFLSPVEWAESRGRGDSLFQSLESVLTFEGLIEDGVLLRQIDQRGHNLRVVLNESAVEVAEAIEPEDIGSRSGCFPFQDCLNFFRIHFETVSADD